MRVSVLVDAYNLYYAGRKLCGRGVPGWRWLDVRSLAATLVAEQSAVWPGAMVERVVYCTARIKGAANPSGAADQDIYLKALLASGSVDHIEYGNYISKVIKRPLATEDKQHKPVIVTRTGQLPCSGTAHQYLTLHSWRAWPPMRRRAATST